MTRSSWLLSATACFAAAFLQTAAFAVPNESRLRRSMWNSTYVTRSGEVVAAHIQFNGSKGTYDTRYGQGRLFDVDFGVDQNLDSFQITGNWKFQGETGRFLVSSKGSDRFEGKWYGNNGGGGRWSGQNTFGTWHKDPDRDRYYCEYRYPAKGSPSKINKQLCIWYPDDEVRSGYYYFSNKENKIWGRCVCPANRDYNPDVMQWSKLDGDSWDELPQGDCPAPKDGDEAMAAIGQIPDPPI